MKKALLLLNLLVINFTSGLFAQGSNCGTADPFCTGTTYTFPNTTGVGNGGTFDCLSTSPNPAWYYLQIASSGNIDINIGQTNTSGAGIDVDFICWGPFSSLSAACATNFASTSGVDCSYSASATETCNIPGAVTGQYYMLLLTNYSNQAGTITFSQSGGAGSTNCSIVNPCVPPNASAGSPLTLTCASPSVTLTASSSTPGVTYSWAGPGGFTSTSQNPVVSAAGTYTVTVNDPANAACPSTAQQVVNASGGIPNVATGSSQLLTCVTTSATLSGSSSTSGATYSWSGPGGFSSTSGTPSVSTAGTYTFTVTDPSNGCTATAQQTVNSNTAPPDAATGSPEDLTCTITSINLTSNSTTPGATYSWNGPGGFTATGSSPAVTVAGTYTLTVTDPANGCTSTAQQVINNNTTPPDAATGSPEVLTCTITSINLTSNSTTPGATYSWSGPGGFTATGSGPAAGTAGTYTVTVTDPANGCTATAQQDLTSNTTPPDASAGPLLALSCTGGTVALTGSSVTSGASFNWNGPGGFTSGTQNPSVSVAGTYTVTVTDPANGCTDTAQQVVSSVINNPNISTGTPQTLTCVVSTVSLSGASTTPDAVFSWSGPGGFTSTTTSPSATAAGTYTLTVTDTTNGCTSTSTQDVVANTTAPGATTGSTQLLTCTITTVGLTATTADTNAVYSWTGPGSMSSSLSNPSVTAAGTYSLTITDTVNGCTSVAQQIVNSNTTPPNVTFGATQTLTCTALTVNLSGSSTTTGATIHWSGPSGFSSGASTPAVSTVGTYTLTITDPANGCTSTGAQVVNSNTTPPSVTMGATQTMTCTVTTASLSASSGTTGATYNWSGPGGFTSTLGSPSTTSAGTYSVTVTDPANGCTSTSTQLVNTNTTPPVANAGTDQNIGCGQPSATLNGGSSSTGSGFTYNWTTLDGSIISGGTTLTPVVDSGTYVLTVTNTTNGCTASNSVFVDAAVTPVASLSATPSSGMAPLPVDFTNTSVDASAYIWNLGNGSSSVAFEPSTTYTDPGTYTVTLIAFSLDGCSDTASITVHVDEYSALTVPNTFTPNGDGHNDTFHPIIAKGLSEFKAAVYDRWGLKLYEWSDASSGWDGRSKNGSVSPDGTYFYIISATGVDGKTYNYQGYISLLGN